jgi:hypothetical protein
MARTPAALALVALAYLGLVLYWHATSPAPAHVPAGEHDPRVRVCAYPDAGPIVRDPR